MVNRSSATGFWMGDVTERNSLENLNLDGRILLKWICNKWDWETWSELLWLRIRTCGGRL